MLARLIALPAGLNILSGLALSITLAIACHTIGYSTLGRSGLVSFIVAGALTLSGLIGLYTRRVRLLSIYVASITFLGLCVFTGFLIVGANETAILKSDPGRLSSDRAFGDQFQRSLHERYSALVSFGQCSINADSSSPVCPNSTTVEAFVKRWLSVSVSHSFSGCEAGTEQLLWCLGGTGFVSDVHVAFYYAKFVAAGLAVSTLLIFLYALCAASKSKKPVSFSHKYGAGFQRGAIVV
jgi:hypothetical protein